MPEQSELYQYFEELGKDVIVEGLKSGQIVNGLREIQSKLSQEAAEWNAVDCLSPKLKQIVGDLQSKVIPVHLFGQSIRIEWANPFAAHMIAKWKADGSLTALFKSPSFMKVVSGLQSEDSNKLQHVHTLATHFQVTHYFTSF